MRLTSLFFLRDKLLKITLPLFVSGQLWWTMSLIKNNNAETIMQITKTTHNFAKQRGLELTTVNNDGTELLCIWEANNDWEWICSFQPVQEQLVFFGNIYLPQECLNTLPTNIADDKELRAVLVKIADAIKTKS